MACFPLSGLALDSVNEFPDPIEVFQKKVRYYITWGYRKGLAFANPFLVPARPAGARCVPDLPGTIVNPVRRQ